MRADFRTSCRVRCALKREDPEDPPLIAARISLRVEACGEPFGRSGNRELHALTRARIERCVVEL